jgi:hypothetical protein
VEWKCNTIQYNAIQYNTIQLLKTDSATHTKQIPWSDSAIVYPQQTSRCSQKHEFQSAQADGTNMAVGPNYLKFSKQKNNFTVKLPRLQFFKSQKSLCSWVTFFVNSANKNTSKNNFNSQLRRDDFLVILYTTRHEFLYRCVMSSHSEDTFYYFPTQPVCHHQGLLQRTTSWIYDDPESELHSTTSSPFRDSHTNALWQFRANTESVHSSYWFWLTNRWWQLCNSSCILLIT